MILWPSSTSATPTSAESASWRKKRYGWFPVIWKMTPGFGSSKSSTMKAPRHGVASPSSCTCASNRPHAPTCSIRYPLVLTTPYASLLMCPHSWIASGCVSRRRTRRNMNVERLYASGQQHGDSWHAAKRRLFMQQKHLRSKQRCAYKHQSGSSVLPVTFQVWCLPATTMATQRPAPPAVQPVPRIAVAISSVQAPNGLVGCYVLLFSAHATLVVGSFPWDPGRSRHLPRPLSL
ncbi:uncharacterized protein LOC110430374 [Sorghum bicolor]|uniref:uncharacterized protein LOC110430374 n=1 Tax=Sorghum bicolor TaxID=4558 RepID=UPI000B42420E|nr:uncharacterized protein LOC110430374 [Sorghum bicolor]|eukprot:XP_021303700.1 uncharacterized protein LOC110430374 [Sorghum bicolor]